MIVHNKIIKQLIRSEYSLSNIHTITKFLEEQKTLSFPVLDNGLFPAAEVISDTEYTGYGNVWIRDNIYLAYAHYVCGQTKIAVNTVNTLIKYFEKHQFRFIEIINGSIDKEKVMKRPHIRFHGETLEEIEQEWGHAQNDALGYFVWFYSKLVHEKIIKPNPNELEIISLIVVYFNVIKYWEDEDSGHWEEDRKLSASSIGVIVAALTEIQLLIRKKLLPYTLNHNNEIITVDFLDKLIQKGQEELDNILPSECIQDPPKNRLYDSALLFLIYPLNIVQGEKADQILDNVINHLQGDYGIRRYIKDSFWCKDYKQVPPTIRTSISTERERWFKENNRELQPEEEAQWCIFDPIISAIFGIKFQKTKEHKYLQKQTHYLNRSLGQITPLNNRFEGFKCPELYYLKKEAYVPGDATPLLWTQANLKVALEMMKRSLAFNNN